MINFLKTYLTSFLVSVAAAPGNLAKARVFCALNLALDEDARRIKSLKDIHKGKRAFIIGNGPSLRMEDLERLKGEITFASNKIFLAFPKVAWRPTYHFIEDDKVLKTTLPIVADFSHQIFLGRDALMIAPRLPQAIYYWRDFNTNPHWPPFQRFPLGHVHMGYSVLYTCLQFAFYMGISEVYLLGVDSHYIKSSTFTNAGSLNTPLYKSEGELNHFDPAYNAVGEEWYDPNLQYQQAGFNRARHEYETSGRSLKNATRGGNLEILERVDFDSLFHEEHGMNDKA